MAQKSLEQRVLEAREAWIEVGGFEFRVRRPTDLQLSEWQHLPNEQFLQKLVINWKVPEHQVVAGGGGEVAAFTSRLFTEWVGDRMEIAEGIINRVMEMLAAHSAAREEQRKK